MWQIFDNSIIRDNNRDNREGRECGRYSIIRKLRPFGCELKVRDYNRDKREGREDFLSLDREEIL